MNGIRRAPVVRVMSRWPLMAIAMLLILGSGWSAARAQSIEGQIWTEARTPLGGATAEVESLQRGAIANAEGRFVLRLPAPGSYALVVRHVGYRTERRTIVVPDGAPVSVDIVLYETPLQGDEVVVRAGRTAADRLTAGTRSITALEPEALDRLRGQTLGETLKELPGVTTMQTGPSIAKPVIRGLHSQRLVVLNAGIPQEGQQWGGEHAPEIDPFAPARIEVVRGAAGVEYGVGAIGGVIRLEPRDFPAAPGVGGRLMLNGFSNSRQGAGSLLLEGRPQRMARFGWRVQGSIRKAGDARTPDYVIGNSAFEEIDGALALGYRTDRTELELHASRFSTELGIFKGSHIGTLSDLQRAIGRDAPLIDYSFSYAIDAPKQVITHDLITLRGAHRLASGDRLEVQYGFQRNHRQEFDAHRRGGDPLDEPAFDLTLNTHTLEAKWRVQRRSDVFGVVGMSGMNQGNVNAESGYLIPNFRALTGGAFAHGTWLRGDWTLEAGTRVDYRWMKAFPRIENAFERRTHDYASVSGVVGAIWRFAPAWSLAANASTAWRPPSVNELYSYGVHHGTAQFEIGAASLTSERMWGLDATLRRVSDRARGEFSVYANRAADFIHRFPTRDTVVTIRGVFPAFAYQQSDAVLRGFDGQIEVDLTAGFALGVTASLVRGTDADANRPLIGMPADRLQLHARLRTPTVPGLRRSELRPELTLVRKQTRVPDGADYAPPPDGYALVGLRYDAEWHLGGQPIHLGLSVHNLLNTRYRDYLSRFRYFIDEPGRTLVLRVQVPFGASASL